MSEERGSVQSDGERNDELKDDMKERFKQQLREEDSFDHLSQYDPDD